MRHLLALALVLAACTRAAPTPLIDWQSTATPSKPVIYKFATSWCPYCARLDETVFADDKVIALSKEFSMVYVDGDLPTSDALMKKYLVRGYPTIIFALPNGNAIDTSNDDPDPDHFLERMRIALGRADPSRKAALDAAQKEAELPLTLLEQAKTEKYPAKQRVLLEKGISLCKDYLQTPRTVSIARYEMAPDYLDALIEFYTLIGDTDSAKLTTRDAGPMLLDRIKAANQPRDARSLFSPTIKFLREAGYYKEARHTAELGINTWPKDFLYHKRLAEVDVAILGDDLSSSKKRLKEALHEYGRAMQYAYGRNMLGVADGYSTLLIRLGRIDDARAVIQKALAAVDWSTNTRQRELNLKKTLESRINTL